jgi:hypothetical protein
MHMSLKYLHPADAMLFTEVVATMKVVAAEYKLPLRSVSPMKDPTLAKSALGLCSASGDIYLCLRARDAKGEWTERRREVDIYETAAHELAHLRHFNHGVQFQEFEQELIAAMRNRNRDKNDPKDKVIDKLLKLQAARDGEAKIGNEAAAEAFAATINRLLLEHELNPTDLDYAKGGEDDPVIEIRVNRDKYQIEKMRVRIAWQEELARLVAHAHLCRFLIVPSTNIITFVGTRSHASVAEYAYGLLVPAATHMSDKAAYAYRKECARAGEPKKANGFRGAWLDAFVQRIGQRFAEARQDTVKADAERRAARGESDPTTTAMIRLSGAVAKGGHGGGQQPTACR